MSIRIRAWTCSENGVRFTFVDANVEIPDNIRTMHVRGDDGRVYTSGIFGFQVTDNDDIPTHIYIVGVQRMDALT
jgi:hypothetical protein